MHTCMWYFGYHEFGWFAYELELTVHVFLYSAVVTMVTIRLIYCLVMKMLLDIVLISKSI